MTTAERLARRVHPDPSPEFIASVAADAELIEIAETDMDAAAQMIVGYAIDNLDAAIAAAVDALASANDALAADKGAA